ncbi:MAG: Rieske 2Fe-2S domain-containing protein [Trueperaceae bacterium]|nr:Rieske 2Fe-2S domain-containing protein [Trueperaceae bacterium]
MSGPPDPQRRRATAWLWRLPVLLALGGGAWGAYEAIRTHFFKRPPRAEPRFRDGPPVRVGPLASFGAAWAATPFRYEGTPALAVRLPAPISGGITPRDDVHLAAFSRVCTHQQCTVSLNRDLEAIAFAFNYRADGPSLVCPCHLSVFDPERAGRAVAGPAVFPLPRVRLAVDQGTVVATGMEPEPVG